MLESHAARMRHQGTPSEQLLWSRLRSRQLGVEFRRQVVLLGGRCIADFCSTERRLVVEVDGLYHERRGDADERRDRALRRAGYRVVHVEAEVVLHDLAAAVELVRRALESPP